MWFRLSTLPWFFFFFAPEAAPPTPEERIAELRAAWSNEHAKFAARAAGKKLGLYARAHYHAALALDPEHRTSRSRLGHRKNRDGAWESPKEPKIRDETSAYEKHGEEFLADEKKLLEERAAAFEKLGLALAAEGREDLARPLLVHAMFLAPGRSAAAAGLGLKAVEKGFTSPAIADAANVVPPVVPAGRGMLGQALGRATETMACGAVLADSSSDSEGTRRLAEIGHRAVVLTSRRFSDDALPGAWVELLAPANQHELRMLLERVPMDPEWREVCVAIGTARIFSPRHGVAVASGSPMAGAPSFLHMATEHLVFQYAGEDAPAWFHEAVGIDASLTMLGSPGSACLTFEASQGLVQKEAFEDPAGWPGLLLRRAALNDHARMEFLATGQIQALGVEDLIAGHAYYRLILLEKPEGVRQYSALLLEGRREPEAFREAFGWTHEDATKALAAAVLGG